ncbi:dipeptide ABC transporter ATP-binding protein [Nakamurella lactea]|uniref:dipeptide ABC transporter ATP-binding protein n=1 Tax=Nakamurella lactea TaxID=459515 RepID=UPI0004035D2A|nr:ABC transporter ATP-binding protein [Nakamurella lactea]
MTTSGSDGEDVLLEVEGLTVTASKPDRTLVRDVGLRIGPGRTLGVVGESGSGKSLTARSLVGLLPAGLHAIGSASFQGISLLNAPERTLRRLRGDRISLLLQDPFTMLNPSQTIGAHIGESLPRDVRHDRQRRSREIERRLLEVGLSSEVAQRFPFQLSGGMCQRVALAAALASDPDLLIADEPTTALDVTTQNDILRLLKGLQEQRGMALILITHDLQVAFSVCDRVQVMYAGSVVEQAPAAELMTEPLHPYSLGLLRSEPPVDHYVGQLNSIPGNVPSPDSVRHVCAFAARCDWAADRCRSARPGLQTVRAGRTSACARVESIAEELRAAVAEIEHERSATPAPPAGPPILTLSEVRKSFQSTGLLRSSTRTVALNGVSFTITAGESLGLVGETGSGKTTIARSILGLTTVDSGTIEAGGLDVTSYRRLKSAERKRARRFVQVVFQDPYASLNPSLTVGSTLREVLALRSSSAADDEVAELLRQVGLPGSYAVRRPAALSGGERQRVAIARAVAMRPELLICDEPVAALDVSAQAQVLELLREIRRRHGMAMLFITHDLSVVRQMADRVVVLYRGEVVESGDTGQVLDRPAHVYTRKLILAVPGRGRRPSLPAIEPG